MFVVHSSSDKNRPHHLMLDHNSEMKAYIEGSFAKYDPFGITQLSNYLHDVGKLTAKNQAILTSENAKRGSVIHAIGGAVVLQDYEDVRAKLAALIVACHHTGLINIQRLFQEKLPAADEDFKQIPFDYPYIGEKIDQILHSNQQFQDQLSSYAHLFVKLSYSALIDADFLSTELYMDERKAVARKDTNSLEFKEYLSLLDAKVRALQQVYSDEPLTKKRSALYYQAKIAGESSQSFLSLVERTGYGKNFASMAFGLQHCDTNNKRRVIVALPQTSIIDQNAYQFKQIFGNDSVLVHHSQISSVSESESGEVLRANLAIENWDAPIIFTTTNQLFQSLFSRKKRDLRKLHNLTNSVIILDEFQKLPLHVLKPIFNILHTLRTHFGVTVLLTSATPYSYEALQQFRVIDEPPQEINTKGIRADTRVTYTKEEAPFTVDKLADELVKHQFVLCIVNTKKRARDVYNAVRQRTEKNVFHLSKAMCPHHLLKTIEQIKNLKKNTPVIVIATSIVETGVNFDFPVVYRELAPLASLIQAAGRSNRNFNYTVGKFVIFSFDEPTFVSEEYQLATEQTVAFLDHYGLDCLKDPTSFHLYDRALFAAHGDRGLDRYDILQLKPLQYEEESARFQMIEEQTEPILFYEYAKKHVDIDIETILDERNLSRNTLRSLQPFCVALPKNHPVLKSVQLNKEIMNGIGVYFGPYCERTGLSS